MDSAQLEQVEHEAAADRIRAAPDELRARLGLSLSLVDGALMTRLERVDLPQVNYLIGLGVSRAARRESLEALIAAYRAAALKRFAVRLAPEAKPAELRDWLAQLGLAARSRSAKLWRDASPPPVDRLCPLKILPVERDQAAIFGRVTCAGQGLPAPLGALDAALVGRARWRAYLAWDGAEPVAAALLFTDGDTAWLGDDVTLPSHRARGAQSALIERRIKDAAAAGARILVAETDQDSAASRNYLQAGFQLAYLRDHFTQTASG